MARKDFDPVLRARFEDVATGLDAEILRELSRIEQSYHTGDMARADAESAVNELVAKSDIARANQAALMRQQLQEGVSKFLDKLDQSKGREARLRRLELQFQAMGPDELEAEAKAFTAGERDLGPDEVTLLSAKLREGGSDLHRDVRTIAQQTGAADHWRADPELVALDERAKTLASTPRGYVRLTAEDGTVDAPLRSLVDWNNEMNQPA